MRWLWIDRVISLEPGVRLVAVKNVTMGEDHIHDHFPGTPIMPASLIVEGMAQSAGILVGHANGFKEKVVLAKVSKAELTAEVRPGFTIRYTATIQKMDAAGASTTGTVEVLDPANPGTPRQIGTIDLIFSHIDQNMAGMEFPAHNFVFGDMFKTLLETSGIR